MKARSFDLLTRHDNIIRIIGLVSTFFRHWEFVDFTYRIGSSLLFLYFELCLIRKSAVLVVVDMVS